ncbi:MAG: CvpA family protein [Deltaproteobacteria bacterium]|nr:CvpA family protein [Deltaproteobacteria bacterium]MBW2661943.1 CvpA family protein [Deltaproteobacteria bacterium]
MNTFDIVIIIILGFCLIRGVFRGLIKEISSIIGVLGGFYAAYTYYTVIAKALSGWISNDSYCNILSFMVVFCSVFLIISILGIIIKYILNIAFLGLVDRICGAGFGAIKGILIVSVLLITLTSFLPKGTPVIKESLLAPHVTSISENMAKIIPKEMKQKFATKIKELKKAWN